nr:hypothetical protein [Tanacetum cinerariifolium]
LVLMLSGCGGWLVVVYGGIARLLLEVADGVIAMVVGGDEEDGGDGVEWCGGRMVGGMKWRGGGGRLMGGGSGWCRGGASGGVIARESGGWKSSESDRKKGGGCRKQRRKI